MSELTAEEIVDLCLRHTLYDWQQQGTTRPIPVASAKGCEFFTVDGKRYLDFNSQLMGVNIGHGDQRVMDAIADQGRTLPYISPFMATEVRARLGQKLADLLPGDLDKVFFTLGGAEANENAIRIAKAVTGRQKILARYRSYHGATYATITLTGDPRRWGNEPGMPGVVHVLDPYHGTRRGFEDADTALAYLDETISLEGPSTIAAFILEPVTGTNGILIPPDGYLQGVRELCNTYDILLIADEVMSGFGRTGEWFAVNHWGVVPDIMTMAKGLTSSYIPLGAVALSPRIYEHFDEHVFYGGLTYNSHPLALAAAIATIGVYEQDGLIEHTAKMGEVMARHHQELFDKHPSVGLVRNIGLFGIVELVRSRQTMEPLAPFNGASDEMKAVAKHLDERGLFTMIRFNGIMTNPPLPITEEQLAEGFGIIDEALDIADQATA
ncbi:MAG TPA: aminotransferase class III-fold pyridoxal phosphate-dependent enzyme [Actinomycetota bacterium]|nr:aminotransferase class III-fold pyridoxal phosphate-dependent enzyme [Actinomycetota bacterium]